MMGSEIAHFIGDCQSSIVNCQLLLHLARPKIKIVSTGDIGVFGADMQCALINDGPVTIFMDSKNKE